MDKENNIKETNEKQLSFENFVEIVGDEMILKLQQFDNSQVNESLKKLHDIWKYFHVTQAKDGDNNYVELDDNTFKHIYEEIKDLGTENNTATNIIDNPDKDDATTLCSI